MVTLLTTCRFRKSNGERCQARPMRGQSFCFWHSPEHAKEAAEARRLGGLRRRKEKITGGVYDFEGLDDVSKIRRLLEIAVEVLNSVLKPMCALFLEVNDLLDPEERKRRFAAGADRIVDNYLGSQLEWHGGR